MKISMPMVLLGSYNTIRLCPDSIKVFMHDTSTVHSDTYRKSLDVEILELMIEKKKRQAVIVEFDGSTKLSNSI